MADLVGADELARTIAAIRARGPLIHNITSAVVASFNANALLALGASPAMAESIDEVAAFTPRCDALVINLGTLSPPRAAAMRLAAAAAAAAGRPWVIDPVAVGAFPPRLALACELLRLRPSAFRGNASEILSLAGAEGVRFSVDAEGVGRGVDTTASSDTAREAAREFAARAGVVVAVTGVIDYVTDGARMLAVANGHEMMTRVTGMGCTATAIVGACLAVEPDPLLAVMHGVALTGIAGELAVERSRGPGSLHVEFLDLLHGMEAAALAARMRVEVVAG